MVGKKQLKTRYKNVFIPENKYLKSAIFLFINYILVFGYKIFVKKIYSKKGIKKQHLFPSNFLYFFSGIFFLNQKVYLKTSIKVPPHLIACIFYTCF
jgi:hypothetical protein